MDYTWTPLIRVGLVVYGIAMFCHSLAICLPFWYVIELDSTAHHGGLWNTCSFETGLCTRVNARSYAGRRPFQVVGGVSLSCGILPYFMIPFLVCAVTVTRIRIMVFLIATAGITVLSTALAFALTDDRPKLAAFYLCLPAGLLHLLATYVFTREITRMKNLPLFADYIRPFYDCPPNIAGEKERELRDAILVEAHGGYENSDANIRSEVGS